MVRNLTRRLFLRGAAVAAPLAALPAVAVAAESYAEENPALLALDEPLEIAVLAYEEAKSVHAEAQRVAASMWKRAPEAITYPSGGMDIERDWNGRGYGDSVGVLSARSLRMSVKAQARWRKITPEREEQRRRMRELLAQAEEYEANCARTLEASRVKEAEALRKATVEELGRIARAAHAEPARTMAGIRFKAKVLRAWGAVARYDRVMTAWKMEGEDWGAGLAASLLEVLEG